MLDTKRLGALLVCSALLLGWWTPRVNADEPEPFFGTPAAAAILNAPQQTWAVAKAGTALFQPGVSQIYDFRSGEWYTAQTMAIWQFADEQMPLGSVRVGYATDFKSVLETQLDVQGVMTRWIVPHLPASVKSALQAGFLDHAWSLLGKVGTVGAFAGYDWDKTEVNDDRVGGFMVGVSLGAKLAF